MSRSITALLLACACATAMSAATARDIAHLSAGDSGCPAEVAAAKAEAADEREAKKALARSAEPSTTPVRGKPTVRGTDAASGSRLQAPRWHSFLPGMFR